MSQPVDDIASPSASRHRRCSRMAVPDALLVGDSRPLDAAAQPRLDSRRRCFAAASTWCWSTWSFATGAARSSSALTADDFELLEDGVRQQIVTFAFEEITTNAAPVTSASTLSAAAATGRRGAEHRP